MATQQCPTLPLIAGCEGVKRQHMSTSYRCMHRVPEYLCACACRREERELLDFPQGTNGAPVLPAWKRGRASRQRSTRAASLGCEMADSARHISGALSAFRPCSAAVAAMIWSTAHVHASKQESCPRYLQGARNCRHGTVITSQFQSTPHVQQRLFPCLRQAAGAAHSILLQQSFLYARHLHGPPHSSKWVAIARC